MRIIMLFLLLHSSGIAFAQQDQPETERYIHFKESLENTEQAMSRCYFLDGIPEELRTEVQRLDLEIAGTFYRDLAERSRMLLFLVEQETVVRENRVRSAEVGEKLLLEVLKDRRSRSWHRAGATLFWGSLAAGSCSLAASYALWFAGERFDQRYLGTTSGDEAALLKAWSALLVRASLICVGVGAISLGISVPALAGSQPR